MQTIHKVCLILTGVCIVILSVGVGLGIVHGVHLRQSNSNDSILEYEAYDEDYVEEDSPVAVAEGRVIDVIPREEGTREMNPSKILIMAHTFSKNYVIQANSNQISNIENPSLLYVEVSRDNQNISGGHW